MNPSDEIVAEIRAAREAYAARFRYDLAEMYKDLKLKEKGHANDLAALVPVAPRLGPALSK